MDTFRRWQITYQNDPNVDINEVGDTFRRWQMTHQNVPSINNNEVRDTFRRWQITYQNVPNVYINEVRDTSRRWRITYQNVLNSNINEVVHATPRAYASAVNLFEPVHFGEFRRPGVFCVIQVRQPFHLWVLESLQCLPKFQSWNSVRASETNTFLHQTIQFLI